jgi:hypothetical protein
MVRLSRLGSLSVFMLLWTAAADARQGATVKAALAADEVCTT